MVNSIAPGKIIVTGEYVGIFGEPVTLTSVDLQTQVEVRSVNNVLISICSDIYPDERVVITFDKLEEVWKDAQHDHDAYTTSLDVNLLKKYRSTKLMPAIIAVAAAVSSMQKLNNSVGFDLLIKSTLPVGSGLGSSASMSAAIIGGIMTYFHEPVDIERVNALAYEVEKILNGKPSGADNSAVVYGGWLRYQRENEKMKITNLNGARASSGWWLIDGGKPSETTLELISKVLELKKTNAKKVDELIGRDRVVTELVQNQIENGDLKPDFLKESQDVLEEFGVIGENGKHIIQAITSGGGQAKVSGAGGIESGVGTIICYHQDLEKIKSIALKEGFGYSPVVFGGPGWRIEK